jgi:hypothetical protein
MTPGLDIVAETVAFLRYTLMKGVLFAPQASKAAFIDGAAIA